VGWDQSRDASRSSEENDHRLITLLLRPVPKYPDLDGGTWGLVSQQSHDMPRPFHLDAINGENHIPRVQVNWRQLGILSERKYHRPSARAYPASVHACLVRCP